MPKCRLAPLAVVLLVLAAMASSASAAPLTFSSVQADPLAAIFPIVTPGSQMQPACGGYCDQIPGQKTPTATAIGSSCTIATSNLTSELKSYANADCGTLSCNNVVTITVACHADSGGFSVSGYETFGCHDSTC